jgi:potassium-transporting ATPase potassium-binding subunit
MNGPAWLLLAAYLAAVLIPAPFLGRYVAAVLESRGSVLRMGRFLERPLYRIAGVDPEAEMSWRGYAAAILAFNLVGILFLFALQLAQGLLPLNPQGFGAPTWDSALNTAVSFVTNTNWQGYGGESTMSYLTQMLGLTVQNFLSAATGIAVAVALTRGFARRTAETVGNAWVDITRVTLYLLLPLSIVLAVGLIADGVIQNRDAYRTVATLEGSSQTLPMGPVASQEAIKMIGTNGGGFFNANSAHPFENPTPLTNLLEMVAIFLIPAALVFSFGDIVGDRRQGHALLAAMVLIFVPAMVATTAAEQAGNPLVAKLGVDQVATAGQAGGNMEGKEARFGIADSALFSTITTAASCGAVNAMHDSFTPLGGLVPMWLMQLGEVVFGGVGSGLYGMLVFAVVAVFVAGLMIGRTPEYLGKKIETFEMQMAAIAVLVTPFLVLVGTGFAVVMAPGLKGIANPGPHGFSEVLYAYSSAANNNGSAFAGLAAITPFYNLTLAVAMLLGRFGVIVPVLAMTGALAAKKRVPASAGTLPTHGPLFVVLLVATVLLVGALTYVPALALGPVVEHLQLWSR